MSKVVRIHANDIYVDVPYSPFDIIYEDFIEKFRADEMAWNKAVEENTTTPYDYEYANAIDVGRKKDLERQIMAYELTTEQKKGIADAQHYLISAVSGLVDGDVHKLPFYSSKKIELGFYYDLQSDDEMELSIQGLHAHLVTLMEGYVPLVSEKDTEQSVLFTIDDIPYYFGKKSITEIANTGFEVGEFIIAMEWRNEAQKLIKKYDGNMDFTLTLRELAVLARRKDEVLPLSDRERELWIDERVKLFHSAKLTFGDVLKVKFFFLHFGRESMIQEIIGYSSRTPLPTMIVTKVQVTQVHPN